MWSLEEFFCGRKFSSAAPNDRLSTKFENSKLWSQPMYVLVIVDEDYNKDDKGGCRGHGKNKDNPRDRCGNRQGGASINAGGGAGDRAAGLEAVLIKN